MRQTRRIIARLLALLFALVFAASFIMPAYAQGDLFADFAHQIPQPSCYCSLGPVSYFERYPITFKIYSI